MTKENIIGLDSKTYEDKEESIEFIVSKLLCSKKLSIATAESCTGGMIASKLIGYPGISEVFVEGAVTYSNEAKVRRLGVKSETLDKFGAVSYETALEMVEGICREASSEVGISTTGIAGPGGGSVEKPVGLVYIGVKVIENIVVEKYIFNGSREEVRSSATRKALEMLRELIVD
ncbi:MAG: CinA family protein [Clostridium sp.]